MEHAILGEIMCHYAKVRGIAGFVVDGAVRDLLPIRELGFPVFAKGITARGPFKEGPGEINTTISCGNVPVHPGDVIVGDCDGIAVVPRLHSESILEQVKELELKERETIAAIYKGEWDRKWVDRALDTKGVVRVD
jgi:regulator of RNase E activity RraA